MNTLENRVYIVTGGSRGFGLAIAECLIQAGAKVGLIGRNQDSLQQAIDKLGANHAYAVSMDISDTSQIKQGFEAIKNHFGRLDGLVNNAGLARPARIDEMDVAEVAAQLNTNISGTVFATQAALDLLKDSDNPRIINISSASSYHFDEISHLSIYAASKAAVERFSRDLRKELQGEGIGVTILRPGNADTDFANGWDVQKLTHALEAFKDAGTYMDTGMQPADVGNAVVYCLSCPRGVSVDLLEIRPNKLLKK